MQTNYPLLSRVASAENLHEAWLRVRGKGAAGGIDGVGTEDFARRAGDALHRLREELVGQTYVPEPLKAFTVPKPGKPGERRPLALPSVRDKVAQEAARRVLEPLFERRFLDTSYGYRLNKGPQKAVRRVQHHLTSGKCAWVAGADIHDFFGSLDHGRLLRQVREVVADDAVVRLVELWLRMGTVDGRGRWRDVYSGVGQGGVISPLLANVYLHALDEHLAAHLGDDGGYVRYSDDFVVLARSRARAEELARRAATYLKEELALSLNPGEHAATEAQAGFIFLGVRLGAGPPAVAPEKLAKIRFKVGQLVQAPAVPLEATVRRLGEALAGWQRYYGSILAAPEFAAVEDAVVEELARHLPGLLARGALGSLRQASEALLRLDLPSAREPRARRALVRRLLAGCRAARAEARPKAPAAPAPPKAVAQASAGVKPVSAEAAVRRKKSRHSRAQAGKSELVLTTPGTFLGRTGDRLVVRRGREVLHEAPAFQVRSVTIADRGVSLSAAVAAHCAEHSIPVVFLEHPGRVRAVLSAPDGAQAGLQVRQVRALGDPDQSLALARQFVAGKLRNQRNLALYLGKYHQKASPRFEAAMAAFRTQGERIEAELKRLPRAADEGFRGKLLSIEGRYAALYWDVIGAALNGKAPDFEGRRREGARDRVNMLLNYGYAVLQSRVHLALVRAGLNSHVSYLHAAQDRRPSLVFDLMEEFRPQVVDRTVVALITRREKLGIDGEGLLNLDTRKLLLRRLHERLATIVRFRGRELTLDEIIQHQANLLADHLRAERRYRPFVGKW